MREQLQAFFEFLFGENTEGLLCISSITPTVDGEQNYKERFYRLADDLEAAVDWIAGKVESNDQLNLYWCHALLNDFRRIKANITDCHILWADLDECHPKNLLVPPTISLETSPGRYQAVWKLSGPVPALDAEKTTKKIAHYHREQGADVSGWDLTQLLRVPFTRNYKYDTIETVKVLDAEAERIYELEDFAAYPEVEGTTRDDLPFPEEFPNHEELIPDYHLDESPRFMQLFEEEPEGDWSSALWELECMLAERDLSPEEIFAVAREASCNKYRRDNRPDIHLWRECGKAWAKVAERSVSVFEREQDPPTHALMPFLSAEERELASNDHTFIEEYTQWATAATDAAPEYHPAIAFGVLSALLSHRLHIPAPGGWATPNLWIALLADTTLTRKSTALDLGLALARAVDPECVMATESSPEGLLKGMSDRAGRTSVFYRDEITGLIDSISKRDYLSGMVETFTRLYDGGYVKRVLSKETIEVRDPVFVMLTAGVRSRMADIITQEHVTSGFLPRFCYVLGESDFTRVRSFIKANAGDHTLARDKLLDQLMDIQEHYSKPSPDSPPRKSIALGAGGHWKIELSPEAATRFEQVEMATLREAHDDDMHELLLPMVQRLVISALKGAALIAACRMPLRDKVIIRLPDLLKSFYYFEQWQEHAMEVIGWSESAPHEKRYGRILDYIKTHKGGVPRSHVNKHFRLTAKEADDIIRTLEERGDIAIKTRSGKGRPTKVLVWTGS